MRDQPLDGHIGQRGVTPDKDSLLDGWQGVMGTGCDRESDAGRRSLGGASLQEEHDVENTKRLDRQTGAMVYSSHGEDCIPRLTLEPMVEEWFWLWLGHGFGHDHDRAVGARGISKKHLFLRGISLLEGLLVFVALTPIQQVCKLSSGLMV